MIIAISGKKGSGKDTVAKIIQYLLLGYIYNEKSNSWIYAPSLKKVENKNRLLFKVRKFADGLKYISSILLYTNKKDFESEDFKNKLQPKWILDIYKDNNISQEKTNRDFLKDLGKAILDTFGSNFFAKRLLYQYDKSKNWIITDLRLKSEYNELKKINDKVVFLRINRFTNSIDTHKTECDLDDVLFENVINNNGSMKHLIQEVENFLKLKILNQ